MFSEQRTNYSKGWDCLYSCKRELNFQARSVVYDMQGRKIFLEKKHRRKQQKPDNIRRKGRRHRPTGSRGSSKNTNERACAYTHARSLLVQRLLPCCTEHSKVALVAPLGVLLGGGEEFVCLFRELLCYGSEAYLALEVVLEQLPLRLFGVE